MTAPDANAAVANANGYTSYAVGMCLQWVRGPCWEIGSFYGSAIDAWNGAKYKHPGDRNPPKGAPCFYRGGSYGHIVIADGNGMRSTDCQSSGRVSHAALAWPETAWGDDYLGWTEDLNGVRLPLGTTDKGGDDVPQYDHASTSKALKLKGGEWVGITWHNVAGSGKAFAKDSTVVSLGGRVYSGDIHCTFDAPQGATLRIRCVEIESGEVAETNPQTEWVATGGSSFPGHACAGSVKAGRTLRVRVLCTQDATLTAADAVFLSW